MDFDLDLNLIKEYAINLAIVIGLIILVYLVLLLIDRQTARWKKRLLRINLKSLKIFGLEIINVGKQELIITTLVHGLQILISLSFLYFALVVILSEIPATEEVAITLVDWIFIPIQSLFNGLIGYLPKLFTIVVTIIVAQYLIKGVKYISSGVIEGNFHFPGFNPHSARTTAGIITFLIYILTIIIILPNMPGYGSLAFNGIATFLGALITIGGSSVIANYMAGIVLTYMHAFSKGDWVEINGVSGQVVGAGAFAVRMISYKEEEISIPNSKALGSAIRNFSSSRKERMMIHTEVSIGYDVPWEEVNALLVNAASRIGLLDEEHAPFVHQKKLDDFYVVYELNAFLNDPMKKLKAQSLLHGSILDLFNEAGIEIMSPHYRAERDGSESTITNITPQA